MNLSRRKFFVGLGVAAAAPAIVRIASVMPISAPRKFMTLADWYAMSAPNTEEIVRLLSETNAMLDDMDFIEGAKETFRVIGAPRHWMAA